MGADLCFLTVISSQIICRVCPGPGQYRPCHMPCHCREKPPVYAHSSATDWHRCTCTPHSCPARCTAASVSDVLVFGWALCRHLCTWPAHVYAVIGATPVAAWRTRSPVTALCLKCVNKLDVLCAGCFCYMNPFRHDCCGFTRFSSHVKNAVVFFECSMVVIRMKADSKAGICKDLPTPDAPVCSCPLVLLTIAALEVYYGGLLACMINACALPCIHIPIKPAVSLNLDLDTRVPTVDTRRLSVDLKRAMCAKSVAII